MSASSMILKGKMTATVKRMAITRDSGGGIISTPQNHLLGVPVFVQDITGDEAVRRGRKSNDRMADIFAPYGTDILEKDILIVGTRTFDITHAHDRDVGTQLQHRKMEAVEKN